MKKFNEMEIEEVISIINDSKELRDMLDQYIQETEMDWLDDLLRSFDRGAVDYSIGFFDQNYFIVKDNDLFLEGVCKSHDNYGLTVKGEKLLNRCEKLQGTNLFGYWCEKLAEQYYKDELKSMVDYVEDASYELYKGSVGEKSMEYVECSDSETFYKPCRVSA